jgi:TolB-like protein/class 3 adenylate cyclase
MASTRRLTAILAADVAGYSRLMGADEEGTHERLRGHFRQLIDPKVREHRGRVVKTTGDGALVEFASVVDAMRCAAEIQRGMVDRDVEMTEERRIRFRIGINLGDVIAEDGDIFGDGVNVAARLEALAEPGGVCLSHTVRDQIRDKLPYPLDDMGEQSVKNIARPVRVYALRSEAVAALPETKVHAAPRLASSQPPWAYTAAVAVLLTIAVGLWWLRPSMKAPPAIVAAPGLEKPAAPLAARRLSIVVLPFANLTGDPGQQYFADGVTEDLTTDLSRIADSFVISRNTAFTYKDKPVDTKQIGQDLGVRYVLEGSVQRSDQRVRVNAQLIDAETDAHVWAERFERDFGDLFALQDDVISRLAVAFNIAVTTAEAARPTANPDALDCILRGRAAWNNKAEAIGWFERALAIDPHSIEAKSWLALALVGRALTDRLFDSAATAGDRTRAEALAAEVLSASPNNAIAHSVKGQLLRAAGRIEEAIPEFEAAIAYYRNSPANIAILGQCKLLTGALDEVIPAEEQAIRLSPRDPQIYNWYTWAGQSLLLQSRIDEAIVWLEKARGANPAYPAAHTVLAAAYALKGDGERAAAELTEARKLVRDDHLTSIAHVRAFGYFGAGYWGVPKVQALFEATLFAGLRKAGMPEE